MKFFHSDNIFETDVKTHLSKRFGKQVEILSSSLLGGGCINHATKIKTSEGVYFLKWNSDGPAEIFLREAESLEELKKAAGNKLIIPEVFAAKKVDETPGFLVLEYIEPGYMQNSDEMLGQGLATIHQYKNRHFGFYNNNFCGATIQENTWKSSWVSFFKENRLEFLLELIKKERSLSVDELKVYRQLLDRLPKLIPDNSRPALIHGDLWSGNYMIIANGPALIDPASCYADREMEMGIMTLFGGFSQRFYDAYNEIYPLPADWKERNKLYQLYHVLNHYYFFGGSYRNQALQIAKTYL